MRDKKELEGFLVKQRDALYCGPACLASVLKYYGREVGLEEIADLAGTNNTGTSLLGLYQAAMKLNFDVEGLEIDSSAKLVEVQELAILHVTLHTNQEHFVVFFGFEGNQVVIGNPESRISLWSLDYLDEVWISRSLLKLSPSKSFTRKQQPREKNTAVGIWQLIKPDLSVLSKALFLGLILSIASLSTAFLTKYLVDKIIPQNEVKLLFEGIGIFIFIMIAKELINYFRLLFLNEQRSNFNKRLMSFIINLLLQLPKSFFDRRKIGDLMSRLNDSKNIQETLSEAVGVIIVSTLMLITSITGIFFLSWQVGLATTIYILLYLLILRFFYQKIQINQERVLVDRALNEANLIDVFSGIDEIKAKASSEIFKKRISNFYNSYQDQLFQLGKIQLKFETINGFSSTMLFVVSVGIASYSVLQGKILIGSLVGIISLIISVNPILIEILAFILEVQKAKASFSRIKEFIALKPEKIDGRELGKINLVEIINVNFSFPGSLPLLKSINLRIEREKIITLLGESGAGKSTILQLLQRFYEPVPGNILANGLNIKTLKLDDYRKEIGVVPQDIKIFNNFLLFNIALSEDPKELEQVPKWCRDHGFDQFFTRFPQGYATLLGEEGANISGGQKQLVGLARALYRNPSVLLIDEGTSAMDRNTEQFILNMIQKIKNDMAILMVTHRMKVARQSDYVYVLENGAITKEGEPSELQSILETA